jgi:hypothetical protein
MVSLLTLSAPQGIPEVRRFTGEGVLLNFIDLGLLGRFARGGDEGMTLLEVLALLSLIISVAAFAYSVGRHTGGKK